MEIGMLANGKSNNWYVEIEEDIDTQHLTLIIESPSSGEFRMNIAGKDDIIDLIISLEALKSDF